MRAIPALLALLLVAGTTATATEPAADTGSSAWPLSTVAPAVTAAPSAVRKVALGINMAPWSDLSLLDQFAADAGRMPAVWSIWGTWGGAGNAFPTAFVQQLRERGVVPMMTWLPADQAHPDSNAYTYRKIVRGDHDAYLRSWAQAAKDYGGTIVLRVFHEMDGAWYSWGVGRFDNTAKRFIAGWRHVWNIFRGLNGVGATNVKFLWSPNYPAAKRPAWSSIYPGDRYVDYVGFTSFNWVRRSPWKSMVRLFSVPYTTLRNITRKPVVASETGSNWRGGSKAAWIRDGYPAVYKAYPQIRLIVYFNVNMEPQHPDWSLTRPITAMAAYRAIAAKTIFQGRFP